MRPPRLLIARYNTNRERWVLEDIEHGVWVSLAGGNDPDSEAFAKELAERWNAGGKEKGK